MFKELGIELPHGNAICYSGYREGQRPGHKYPSREQIKEDLNILAKNWQYLRLYDCTPHAELVLRVITDEALHFKVMLGVDLAAEVSNPNCPWGANYTDDTLADYRRKNDAHIDKAIELAAQYPDIVFCISIGNEASVEWTDHMVPVERLIHFAERIKQHTSQPVTFCENYVPWADKLKALAERLDFISIHSYPAWEYRSIDQALTYTKQNYHSVIEQYPNKPVIITEAGWTTASNGRGIDASNASEELQAQYYRELLEWTTQEKILTFVFEAFDEPWKGSPDPLEPEKHWGLFDVKRRPKLAMRDLYGELLAV
ncbi:MAG: glycosyl hydrolase family 17 protein [Pseudomonadota bacterium]